IVRTARRKNNYIRMFRKLFGEFERAGDRLADVVKSLPRRIFCENAVQVQTYARLRRTALFSFLLNDRFRFRPKIRQRSGAYRQHRFDGVAAFEPLKFAERIEIPNTRIMMPRVMPTRQ